MDTFQTENNRMSETQSTPNSPDTNLTFPTYSIIQTGRITEFHCPCCENVALEVGKLDPVEVCFCPNCGGFVLDNTNCGGLIGDLRADYVGADLTPALLDQKQLEVQIACPACRESMEVHPYYGPGNAVIDSCRHCKLVWFNAGELDCIIRAPGLRRHLVAGSLKRLEPSQHLQPLSATGMDDKLDCRYSALDFVTLVVQSLFR